MTTTDPTPTRKPFDAARMCGVRRRSDDLKGPGRKGEPCRHTKGWGTAHRGNGPCRLHLGTTATGEALAAKEGAAKALLSLGMPIEANPQQALLEQVWEAFGNVAFLRSRVKDLGLEPAVAGRSGDARPHIFVTMYNEERDRLAKMCQLAVGAGIAERAIAMAEQQAEAIVAVVTRVLDSLKLPEKQRLAAQQTAVAVLQEFAEFDVVAVGAGASRARA